MLKGDQSPPGGFWSWTTWAVQNHQEKNFNFQVQAHFCRTKLFQAKILIFQEFGQSADGRQGVNIIHSLSAIILKTYL